MKKEKTKKITCMSPNDVVEIRNVLNTRQMDCLSAILWIVNDSTDDPANLVYTIDGAMIASLFPDVQSGKILPKRIYERLREGAAGLVNYTLETDFGRYGSKAVVVSQIDWDNDNHSVKMHLSPLFKSLIVEAARSGNYTTYELAMIFALPGKYSKHLYPWLKRFADTGWRTSDVKTLMQKVGAPANMKTANFMQRILMQAVDEINTYTDLAVSYTTKTVPAPRGVSVKEITFAIKNKVNAAEITKNAESILSNAALYSRLRQIIPETEIPAKTLRLAITKSDSNYDRIIRAYEYAKSIPTVRNLPAYMLKTLDKGWAEDNPPKRSTFSDFPQRKKTGKDYAELERKKLLSATENPK